MDPVAPLPPQPPAPPAARVVAAIDVGSSAIRMVVAEVAPDGQINVLERLQRGVRLGHDTFMRGRLGGQSMRAAVAVLRDFQQVLRSYRVERVRAVATSAVREAGNADTFLDRIFMAADLRVEVVGTSEESRLTVSAVRHAIGDVLGVSRDETLLANVGGGSTLLTLLYNGEIASSQSLRLGSLRLQEMLATSQEPPKRAAALLRQQILNETAPLAGSLPLDQVDSFVAVGSDAHLAAAQVGKPHESLDLMTVERNDFAKFVRQCEKQTAEELVKRYALPFPEAETLVPALLIYQVLLQKTRAPQMIVSGVSIRDGLLLELAEVATGQEDQAVLKGVIQSALAIAEKYRIDLAHAQKVADLAVCLFDQLQAEHGLGSRHRVLLRVAGLLHEVGAVVSSRAHHKHSYYLLANSEIFGLNREEILIVAHVARYHRRSSPRPSHLEYMSLPRETRVLVNKLAALLRVADALQRGHLQQPGDLRFERQGDEFLLYIPGGADLTLERRALAAKGDLFEDIYGIKVRLEEA